ncbi:MAG: hypothetical protein L0216_13260 [Planctomycetales bacterium]|nr:hypothetical protein [Planctomycetales bacterium]
MASGCAAPWSVVEGPSEPLAALRVVEVRPFELEGRWAQDEALARVGREAAAAIARRAGEILASSGRFEGLPGSPLAAGAAEPALVIEGTIVDLSPGRPNGRYLLHVGEPAGRLVLSVRLEDRERRTLAAGRARGGLPGRCDPEALAACFEEAARAVADLVLECAR